MTRPRILYVEESEDQRRELKQGLLDRGFDVREVPTGKDGLEALGAHDIDVVLCDLDLPGIGGMEVLARLRISHPYLPLIFVTALPSVPLTVRAIRTGAYRVLTKPVRLDELELTLHQAVEHARMWRWLREADDQLRLLVETSPVPYIISRVADGRILYVNEHLATLVGLSAEEIRKHRTTDFYFDPAERATVLSLLQEQGHLHDHEVRIKAADGTPIWVVLSLAKMDLGGEPVILGGLTNITRRKNAEESLVKERNFISAILHTAGGLIVVSDPEGCIIRTNRAFQAITGYSLAEVEGRPFWNNFLIEEEKEAVKERFERIRTGPWPVQGENHWRTKSGELRLIDWSNTALLDESGDLEYVVSVGVDITERRKAEEKLQLYREIFTNSIDVITILDREGRIIERNPAHEKKTGYIDEEVLGLRPNQFLGENQLTEIYRTLDRAGSYRGELLGTKKDGTPVWVDLSIFPILDASGKPHRFVGMGRDITEIKMALADLAFANQELRDAQAQLVQSEKMASLGSLVAGIAHEINTPVGAIGSMHDTLVRAVAKLGKRMEEKAPELIDDDQQIKNAFELIRNANDVIKTGCSRVTEIVRRLRSFARLDEAELKRVDIHEGIEDTLVLLHHEIKHNITVERKYGTIPPFPVYPGRLNQVFLNILVNARQAIEGKGTITIATYVADNKAHIAISDTGAGISPENIRNIFDPGFTTKGVGVGTGLGLSICYQIVQEHKGRIRVDSQPGKGTTFTIILPMNLNEIIAES